MTEDISLIKYLGIETLPDEKKAKILDQSSQLIEQRLMIRLFKSLNEEQKNELTQVLESNDKSELDSFIADAAPDFLDWIQDEASQLKDELKSLGEI